jgi:phosphomannomutase / phosphoglucomutase
VAAGDFRTTTPALKEALTMGLVRGGMHVLDAGQIPTPIAYFAHHYWKSDAVLIVTASHCPPHYNGLKLMVGQAPPSPDELEHLRRKVKAGSFRESTGRMVEIDPLPLYREWILQRWSNQQQATPIRVVLDAGNGAWSAIAPGIFECLGFGVQRLFCEIDGQFPNRPPDCAPPRNLAALSQAVREGKAQLGIAWDGDGDRVAFCDETGAPVMADELAVLLARDVLAAKEKGKVVYDLKLSDILRRTVQELGGTPIAERSGHTFIKRHMIQEDCLLGCEASGHYFFRELRGGDDGLFTALYVCDIVRRNGLLGSLRKTVPPIHITPDLRLPTASFPFELVADRLRSNFQAAQETKLDGLRLETSDGFVLMRESVTEPAVTLRLEGVTVGSLERLITICLRALPEAAEIFQRQMAELQQKYAFFL